MKDYRYDYGVGRENMRKSNVYKVAAATIAMGLIIPQVLPSISFSQGNDVIKLRILETSDIHTNIVDYDYYQTKPDFTIGLARTATLIKAAKKESANTLLFDNGDSIQGNPLGDYINKFNKLDSEDHPFYRVLNLLGYDAATVGNHEFNYGLSFLNKVLKTPNFPVVNANVYKDDQDGNPDNDTNYFTPYKILTKEFVDQNGAKQTVKVGVIGFVPPQITQWDKGNLEGKVITKDIIESAKKFIPKMKAEGADVIVALSHSGMGNEDSYTVGDENVSAYLAKNVPDIDAVLTGHSHLEVAKTINGVPVTMPSSFGSALGVIDLELSQQNGKWVVNKAASKAELRKIYSLDASNKKVPAVDADLDVLSALQGDHTGTIDYVNQQVGITTAPINSYFALVQDDPSIQIVTNAQKDYIENWIQSSGNSQYKNIPVLSAGAPFKAGGRMGASYYTDIPTGKLAIKNMADLYVYPNTVYAVLLTGADVKEWLEMSAGQFQQIDPNSSEEQSLINNNFPTYNFDVLDGVQYQIDVTQPAKYDTKGKEMNPTANRIVNVMYNGKAIDDNQQFIVATNNYRGANAGNPTGFPGVKNGKVILAAPDENRQVIVNYIQKKGTVNPTADGNWSFKQVIGKTLHVTFESSPNAKTFIPENSGIFYSGEGANGFVKYELPLSKQESNTTTPTTSNGSESGDANNATTSNSSYSSPSKSGNDAITVSNTNSKQTNQLPNTATTIFAMMAVGMMAAVVGAVALFKRRKTN